jgi:hypothetical protein
MTSNFSDRQGVRMTDRGNGRQGVGQGRELVSNFSDR